MYRYNSHPIYQTHSCIDEENRIENWKMFTFIQEKKVRLQLQRRDRVTLFFGDSADLVPVDLTAAFCLDRVFAADAFVSTSTLAFEEACRVTDLGSLFSDSGSVTVLEVFFLTLTLVTDSTSTFSISWNRTLLLRLVTGEIGFSSAVKISTNYKN